MKKFVFITVILFVFNVAQAQYLAAFNDNLEQFWAFEAGMFNQLEDSEVLDFQVGGTLIAYLDEASNFKIYQYGAVKTAIKVAPIEYTATDYLLGYSLIDTLYVYDNENIIKLSDDCLDYIVMDSIVVWQNRYAETINIFYNGEITTIAENISEFKLEPYMVGDNLFAYVNPTTQEFTIFYRGKLFLPDTYTNELKFQAGCDILAYTNIVDKSFNIFYKGEVRELDIYQPKSFQVGDQMVAYIDNQDDLKIFENDQVINVSSDPEFYEVKDHILVFENMGSFKTVCNGQVYIIEQYVPRPYYIDVNTVAYLENNESIRVFQHCKHIVANKVDVIKFNMVRNVIVYAIEEDEIKVYFNGEVYTQQID